MSGTGYRFAGADYQPDLDYVRLASHLERIRALMLDGRWRTPAEISHEIQLPPTADITKQLRHLRYPEHGQHRVERRRRGEGRAGLYEYRVHPAGSGDSLPHRQGVPAELEAAQMTVELLADALRRLAPSHPLLIELGL